jgi:hypothetical protein
MHPSRPSSARAVQPQVRVSAATHAKLVELAAAQNVSMTEILDRAVEAYRRQWFFETANEAYARLRNDPAAWADWQSELAAWDATLMDGLEDEPPFELTEDGAPQEEQTTSRA